MDNSSENKIGLARLSAIVFGSVIGVGIFNIAQNMAAGAEIGAVLVAWAITAAGILSLVYTFKALSDMRPDLNAGIYQYAQVGFGNYMGFNIAWGYWLCTAFGNVAYAVMLNDSLAAFFPVLNDHGWPTVAVSTVLIWGMCILVLRGVRTASLVNLLMTLVKAITLVFIIAILAINFKYDLFSSDFWGKSAQLGGIGSQVRSTMMVTLWCFLGIEGAVVMSARAKRPKDVGRAGLIGFFSSWLLYLLVSALCFGVMAQAQMRSLPNPSLAYILIDLCGHWAYYFVIGAVIVSLLGGWVAWTLICAQVPYEAASVRIFPKAFNATNNHDAPRYSLIASSVVMEVCILLVVTAKEVYMAAYEMAGMMVLPAYLFCGLFLLKATVYPHRYLPGEHGLHVARLRIAAVACIAFCLWTIYSGGLLLLLTTSLLYLPGFYFYAKARKQNAPDTPLLTPKEKCLLAAIIICALASIPLIFTNNALSI